MRHDEIQTRCEFPPAASQENPSATKHRHAETAATETAPAPIFRQGLSTPAKSLQHLRAVPQFAHVGDFLRRLHGEPELRRSFREPLRQRLLARNAIETVIDFRRRKTR